MLPIYRRVAAHWRAVIALLILAAFAPLIRLFGLSLSALIPFALFLIFLASQLFWIGRVLDLAQRFIPGAHRRWLAVAAGLLCLFFLVWQFTRRPGLPGHHARADDLWIGGFLTWWLIGSMAGFALLVAIRIADLAATGTVRAYRKTRQLWQRHASSQPMVAKQTAVSRRHLLEQMAVAVSAMPFAAAAYGLLYERLDVQVTHRRIRLARLPKAFDGFRIALLGDFHFNPFNSPGYIRRCVATANGLKPDLIAMTGDYVDWDETPQREVVEALSGLRASYGVFGCLGNHEAITSCEDSITQLFAARGIRILRQERAPIRLGGEMLNLIGMDSPVWGPNGRTEEWLRSEVNREWQQVKELVMPDKVNILLTHFPWHFVRAAELGIDLTLAGHTHGGQLGLFMPEISFARLETDYPSGWYEKSGRQLYVNRGVGTISPHIRLGARPEITVLELTRT